MVTLPDEPAGSALWTPSATAAPVTAGPMRLARVGLDPAADPLNATPIDPVLHVTAFDHMPAELPTHLTSAEHFRDPATGRVVRRRVPLWVRRANGYERPLGLVPLVDQSLGRRSNGSPLPPVGPATAAFADCADPLVPVVLAARRRALVRYSTGVLDAVALVRHAHRVPAPPAADQPGEQGRPRAERRLAAQSLGHRLWKKRFAHRTTESLLTTRSAWTDRMASSRWAGPTRL